MTDDAVLIQALVELAGTLVQDFDVVELLTLVSERCMEVLDVAAVALMLVDEKEALRVVASSNEASHLIELFELESNEGPAIVCYRTGAQVVNQDLEGSGRLWPRFAAEAARTGFRSAHAVPMRSQGEVIGALSLFRAEHAVLDDRDVVAAQALADVATIAILQQRTVRRGELVNRQLQAALNSRILIEQAKGMIAERAGIDVERAFERLRRTARSNNRHLSELAADVVNGTIDVTVLGEDGTPDPSRRPM